MAASRPFKKQTKAEQIRLVREAILAGHTSNIRIAEYLGTTPGTVAGIRFRNKIPLVPEVSPAPEPSPRSDPAEVHTKESDLPPLKVAASEATQCMKEVLGDKRCAFERLPRSKFCAMHQPKK